MIAEKLVEAISMIGKKGIYSAGGMKFPVMIENVKVGYGKVYYYISNGVGEGKWTTEDCIEAMTSEKTKAVFGFIKETVKEFIMP